MSARRPPLRRQLLSVTPHIVLGLAVLLAIAPLIWGLSTSLKPLDELNAWPPTLLPQDPTVAHYVEVLNDQRLMRYFLNTFVVIGMALIVTSALAAHAAYAVARFDFGGKRALMLLMWCTVMIPGVAIIVPKYLISVFIGIYDTLLVLVLVYSAWLVPTLVWLLRGFVETIPRELEEAAQIDGSSLLGAFYRIVLPLTRPGLIAGGTLVFVNIWNEFLMQYALVLSDSNRMIQVGIYFYVTEIGVQWGPLTAAVIATLVPILILFAFLQKSLVQGLTAGAVKG